ncbi:MAG: FAD-binding protein [Proteobacteria bacterium]|nr:FAD-binding protein [Pseudomonadota bacterium]
MFDREVDVVSIGSGLGGVTAALHAVELGGTAIILEKAPKLGGVCAYSGGEVFVCMNHLMQASEQPDNETDAHAYLDFLAGGYADPELAQILFDMGPKVAKWVEERGVKWRVISDFPDYYYPHAPGTVATGRYLEPELFDGHSLGEWRKKTYTTPHMPPGITHDELFAWGGLSAMPKWDFATMGGRIAKDIRGMGPAMMGWFIKATVVDRGVEAHVSTPAIRLITEGGKVIGVEAEKDGKPFRIRARKGVVVACGGYDWNEEMAKHFEGLPEWGSMTQPYMEGDNMVLGGEVGAALAGVPSYNLGMFFGYQVPGEKADGRPMWRASWEGGYPHAMWVNKKGVRFADESFYRDYLPRCHDWDGVEQEHPNYPPYLIFDQNYRDKYAFCSFMPGVEAPEALLKKADTPAELAEKLGIDPEGLTASIARFNEFADGDTDPDFGRGRYPWAAKMVGDRSRVNQQLGPLDKPPYYGVRLTAVGVGVNAVGLKTNGNGQVMHVRGRPIEGLYAAGNSAALLDIGAGYQSGLSNLRGMVWGWMAAKHAMES